jgi:hypothetical protein
MGERNQCLISARGKGFFSFPQHPDQLWGLLSLLTGGFLPGNEMAEANPLTSQYMWSHTSIAPYILKAMYLIKHTDSFMLP